MLELLIIVIWFGGIDGAQRAGRGFWGQLLWPASAGRAVAEWAARRALPLTEEIPDDA